MFRGVPRAALVNAEATAGVVVHVTMQATFG